MADDNRTQQKSWYEQMAVWGIANAIRQKTAMDRAVMAKGYGANSVAPEIPFGNVTNVSNSTGADMLQKLVVGAAAAFGLGAGGLGLASLLGFLPEKGQSPPPAPSHVSQPVAPEDVPLIIDWSLENAGTGNGNETGN